MLGWPAYAHAGKWSRLRAITSVVIPDATFWWNAERRELLLSGLRLAMGEAA